MQAICLCAMANADGLDVNLDLCSRSTTAVAQAGNLQERNALRQRRRAVLHAAKKPGAAIVATVWILVWSCVGAVRKLSTSAAHFASNGAPKINATCLAKKSAYQRTGRAQLRRKLHSHWYARSKLHLKVSRALTLPLAQYHPYAFVALAS